eukprot:CAMPEP_0202358570 /NCGR_PEP_ID=MMETSP1126-20121109/12193_1 /ASSEMBLY_ACC=CAM_ASM_000457 /TAXON_ID=3047 /ORGANISM="Dunaliella tertiolecta, Strain CCMP1320" /LENGTH=72 /DNA_ID=CAMNT_0048951775 /DNA_START=356 /DNA_END=574 /DNA_ORIENTATION=+
MTFTVSASLELGSEGKEAALRDSSVLTRFSSSTCARTLASASSCARLASAAAASAAARAASSLALSAASDSS